MDLNSALGVAGKYAASRPDNGLNCAVLGDGHIVAQNVESGVRIPCEAATVSAAVDCATLAKMVKALNEPTLSRKGDRLVVEGSGGRYTLQVLEEEAVAAPPPIPTEGWVKVTGAEMSAIAAIAAGAAPRDAAAYALSGIRFHHEWTAAASATTVAVAWKGGVLPEPFTMPADTLAGLRGDCEFSLDNHRVFVREASSGQIRWCTGIGLEWPDSAVENVLVAQRNDAARVRVDVAGKVLAGMFDRASVVADNPLVAFRITVSGRRIACQGSSGATATGIGEFVGDVEVEGKPDGEADVATLAEGVLFGISPAAMSLAAGVIAKAGGDILALSVNGPLQGVIVWGGGEVQVEVLTMPLRLDEGGVEEAAPAAKKPKKRKKATKRKPPPPPPGG